MTGVVEPAGDVAARLAEIRDRGLHRRLRVIAGPQGPSVVLDGRPVLLLCSNNYLGLADDPRVTHAAADAALAFGAGAGGSRLVSGTMEIHRRLEERLAALKGTEGAILFGSGYLANLGVLGALASVGAPGERATVFSDALNHASIIDGCRLARADVAVYRHADVEHLAWSMAQVTTPGPQIIVTDTVFSMDGDVAPLADLVALARRTGARLVADEAHATGCCGPQGRGAVAAAGLDGEVDVVIGTLGKALGSYGAFAACSAQLVELLVNTSRPLIFSTAPPPPSIAAALAALDVVAAEPERVAALAAGADVLRAELRREGFEVEGSTTQIVPLVVGDADLAMRICEAAIGDGVFAQAIRPPTVPEGTSRLRLAVMATHSHDELRRAARTLGAAARDAGLPLPARRGVPVATAPGAPVS